MGEIVAREAYPSVPLFRYAYRALDLDRVTADLAGAVARGPAMPAAGGARLAGTRLNLATDGGPSLSWSFTGNNWLSLSVDGAPAVEAGYGALELHQLLFFAHLVPGSPSGYAVVVDRTTMQASVTEFWYGGLAATREPMRAIWHGQVADAREVGGHRHVATNLVEGKAIAWTTDKGVRTLEYYVSAAYTHWVELTRLDGKRGYSAPADYIALDGENYLFTRTESEFSGMFTIYAMNVNTLEQVGLRIGFDGLDRLEYELFTGTGEWLGQIARFENFDDQSGAPIAPPDSSKGSRRVYRPLATMPRMSKAEVAAAVAANTHVFDRPSVMAGNGHPPSPALTGKTMVLRWDDGPAIEYRFDSHDELSWRRAGEVGWTKARYNAWESMPGVFIFGHMLAGTEDHEAHIAAIDLESGKATLFNGYLNTPAIANEAGVRVYFGKVEADGVPDPGSDRHGFTRDMIGRCLTWNYSKGLTSMHLYSTPYTTSWIIFTPSGHGGMQWSGSGAHVKIRDGLYFINWLEEACNGTLGTLLFNMRTMHDAGIGYHCDEKGLSMGPVGAIARHAGKFDVDTYFADRKPGDVA
jgi:hypothetical protein